MKIIIAGGGKVGYSVAENLAGEGHDITIIEKNPENITSLSNSLDVICVEGSASNPETLREAGAETADLLVAATERDEINMICSVSAHKLGTNHVIARIRDPEYIRQGEFLRDALGLSRIVNPEYECAKEISRILRFPTAARVDVFSQGSIEIVEYKVPEGGRLDGVSLKDLPQKHGAKVLIGIVERGDEAVIPNGDYILHAGDRLNITGTSRELRRFFASIGAYKHPVKHIMIVGGGRIAVYLTRLVEESGIHVTIIEKDEAQCERVCDLLADATVVHGDPTHIDVLLEEGLRNVDAFVALTGDDGSNIITSMFAKNCDVEKIITKIDHEHYASILEEYGIDSVITPRGLVAQQLIHYVRALDVSEESSIETLHLLADGKVEALEFKVQEGAACAGIPLRNLKLKKNILISAVIRNGKAQIPDGGTVIQPGDHAVVITTAGRLSRLDEIVEET
ncbi:MAG: Trk system potassium transporter TrkA [Oscillospiraceae bacterium]|nr:Trk system potassium transporter TrkA [Oscillospiraceae bacterium]